MAMVKAKMKNPEVTRTAGIITLRESLIYSSGLWNNINEPSKREMMPPIANKPWLITLISAMKRMIAKRINARPA